MAKVAKRRGRYVIDFYDNQGKRRWKTMPEGTTKARAKEILRDIEDQLSKGVYLPDKKIPTFEEVAQNWLEFKKANVRESTWLMYKGHLRHHFDSLKPIKIKMITTARVEKFISEKQKANMNLTTLRKLIVTFNQVMNYAVRHQYIGHNPVRDAERPKGKGQQEKEIIRILPPKEIQALLSADMAPKYRVLFKLAIMSGARQGELLGLKWKDVDWTNSQIHIQRTFNKGCWYKPKTKTSNRKVDIGPSMMKTLKEWRIACPPNDLGLIFPNEAGNPIAESNMMRRHFFPALKAAEIQRIRFHDLRHTYASLLIAQGENIKYIQKQLGHSTPTITLDVYAHLFDKVNTEAACRLENTIFETNGSKMVANNKKGITATTVIP